MMQSFRVVKSYLILLVILIFYAPTSLAQDPLPVSKQQETTLNLIISNVGLSENLLKMALEKLSPEVSLAFYPLGDETRKQISQAQKKGFEVFVLCPMEPVNYPQNDPGPNVLLTGIPSEENVKRLESVINTCTNCSGIVGFKGSLFTISEPDLKPILQYLDLKKIHFIDDGSTSRSLSPKLSTNSSQVTYIINTDNEKNSIHSVLAQIIQDAPSTKKMTAICDASFLSIEILSEWVKTLKDKNIVLKHFINSPLLNKNNGQ